MNVSFSDKKLEQCSEDGRYCIKYLGSKRAKIFMTRITNLKNADSLEDVRCLPGKFHELVGTRKG